MLNRVVDPGYLSVANVGPVDEGASSDVLRTVRALRDGDPFPHVASVVSQQAVAAPAKPRFGEATLVAELERAGVGRPSTYATIVRTLLDRRYATLADDAGTEVELVVLRARPGARKVCRSTTTATHGAYRRRLVPTKVGEDVADYLERNFPSVLDPDLTSKIEDGLDRIARGDDAWRDTVRRVWRAVEPYAAAERRRRKDVATASTEAALGHDPTTRLPVYCYDGRYGPVVRLGDSRTTRQRARFASVPKGLAVADVSLSDALFLLSLPKVLKLQTPAVTLHHGRHGFFVKREPLTAVGKPTTRTVRGGLDVAKNMTAARANALLDAPPPKREWTKKAREASALGSLTGSKSPTTFL